MWYSRRVNSSPFFSAPSSGLPILVIGVSLTVFMGVVYAFAATHNNAFQNVVDSVAQRVSFSVAPPDPWWEAYARMLPTSTQTLTNRGATWRVTNREGECVLEKQERATWVSMASASVQDCVIGGGSIDGRYLTIGHAERGSCVNNESCVRKQGEQWWLYNDRPRLIRAVPRPVPDGEWLAVDPVRGLGLYRGRLRSTLRDGVATRYWITDGAGAALWSGIVQGFDAEIVQMVPLQMISRSDGALLLAYRAQLANEQWQQRLTLLRPTGAPLVWKRLPLPETWPAEPWRIGEWLGVRPNSVVELRGQSIDGTTTSTHVPLLRE